MNPSIFPPASQPRGGRHARGRPDTWAVWLAAVLGLPRLSPAQSQHAVSREISIANYGSLGVPVVQTETISREVSVGNYGVNKVTAAVGLTALRAGMTGNVPVTVASFLPLTNLALAVDFPPARLSNWILQAQSPYAGSVLLSNGSRLYLNFSNATPGQTIAGGAVLGQIAFASASNQPTAFLPLPVSGVSASPVNYDYNSPSKLGGQNGAVVVFNSNSLLQASRGTNGTRSLALYGFTGTNYTIQSATNLASPNWQTAFTSLVPTNFVVLMPNLAATNPVIFYRAVQ